MCEIMKIRWIMDDRSVRSNDRVEVAVAAAAVELDGFIVVIIIPVILVVIVPIHVVESLRGDL